jgi:hypothetical protein
MIVPKGDLCKNGRVRRECPQITEITQKSTGGWHAEMQGTQGNTILVLQWRRGLPADYADGAEIQVKRGALEGLARRDAGDAEKYNFSFIVAEGVAR